MGTGMTSPKSPSPQGISALLRKAGFEKSESSATRIKGWRNHSEGYSVAKDWIAEVGDCISVAYNRGLKLPSEADLIRPDMFARYAEAITAAGYSAEIVRDRLIVTTGKATQ